MPKTKSSIAWVANVSCEGGPLMVVDLPDFAYWTGAMPFSELRADPRRKAALADRMKTVHYWGQFTDRLPAPFAADGGHQFLECASEDEARTKLAELRAAVAKQFPNVEINDEGDRLEFSLPDTEEAMTAELAPMSEYDAAWQSHEDDEGWIHTFREKKALFWEIEGDGTADVGLSADKKQLVLVRSWLSGEDETEAEEERAVRALAETPQPGEVTVGELVLPSGKAVIIWSPVPPFQLQGLSSPAALANLGSGKEPSRLDTDEIEGVGAVVALASGRYRVTVGSTDEDQDDESEDREDEGDESDDDDREWSCRWCRLTWIGEA